MPLSIELILVLFFAISFLAGLSSLISIGQGGIEKIKPIKPRDDVRPCGAKILASKDSDERNTEWRGSPNGSGYSDHY